MSDYKFLKDLVEILVKFFEPFMELTSLDDISYFLLQFGWKIEYSEDSIIDIFEFDELAVIIDVIDGTREIDLENIGVIIEAIKEIFRKVGNIAQASRNGPNIKPFTLNAFWDTFPEELLDYLITRFFKYHYRLIFNIFKFLGIFSETKVPGTEERYPYIKKGVHWERFSYIFDFNIKGLMEEVYNWGSSDFNYILFMNNLKGILLKTMLYIPSEYLLDLYYSPGAEIRKNIPETKTNLLSFINNDGIDVNFANVDLIGMPIPGQTADVPEGLMFGLNGFLSGSKTIDLTESLKLEISGSYESECGIRLEILHRDITPVIDLSGDVIEVGGALKYGLPTPKIVFGSPGTTRFEFESIRLSINAGNTVEEPSSLDFSTEFELKGAKLVIQASDGDGFINKILPKNPITINFDLLAGYSLNRGFYLSGGAGFEYTIPIYKSIGPIFVNTIDLKGEFVDGNIVIIIAITGGAEIGPLTAVIEKIGLILKVELGKPGLLGKADLSLGFKPPTAIGLSINTDTLSGGGYLRIDPPNYAGILNLSVSDKFAITAIGLLTTELPGGKKGFSLLLSLMAEFATPIQLGYGFALYGVGGLIGINRRMNKGALIEAQKAHLLDSVLFPEDPIRNATSIIDTISNIFPPEEGYYVFGPMVRLFWGGVRHLVDFDVGIFIEFGGDGLVALIGLAHALLPTEENPIVELHMDILGVIDFGNKSLEIRSSLYNSSLLERFTLSGDMALQSNWGDNPDFVLSIGGFHPSFNPPAGFPNLRRVSISFGSDNPRASLSMYLAITTNTFQTGASLDFYAAAGKFSLKAHLGFDTLIQFKPFKFIADIDGNASINLWDEPLFSVGLNATLEGPNRYHIFGRARFTYLKIDCTIPFNKYFGDTLPDETRRVNPYNTLKNALEMAKPICEVPSWANEGVNLVKGAESYLSPVGNITINQNAVPLDHNLSKFGGRSLRDEWANRFTLDPDFGDGDLIRELEPAPESNFAPAQFFSMNDNEKLTSPAFEEYPSGIRIGGIGRPPNSSAATMMEYETFLINSDGETVQESVSLGVISILEMVIEDVRFQGNMHEAERVIRGWEMQGSKQYLEHEVEVNVGPTIKAEKFIVAPDASCKFATDDSMVIGDSGELLWEYWQKDLNDSRSGVKELTNFQANEIVNRVGGVVMSSSLSEEIAILEASMTIVRDDRAEFSTMFENYDQNANQLFNILSTVLKGRKEMKSSTTRNMI